MTTFLEQSSPRSGAGHGSQALQPGTTFAMMREMEPSEPSAPSWVDQDPSGEYQPVWARKMPDPVVPPSASSVTARRELASLDNMSPGKRQIVDNVVHTMREVRRSQELAREKGAAIPADIKVLLSQALIRGAEGSSLPSAKPVPENLARRAVQTPGQARPVARTAESASRPQRENRGAGNTSKQRSKSSPGNKSSSMSPEDKLPLSVQHVTVQSSTIASNKKKIQWH